MTENQGLSWLIDCGAQRQYVVRELGMGERGEAGGGGGGVG